MKTTLKKTLTHLIVTAAIFAGSAAFAKWDIVTSTDPMTDETQYTIGTFGDKYAISEYIKATPSLLVRITPQRLNAAGEVLGQRKVILLLETDRIDRDGTTILARFDKDKAEEWECSASTDRMVAFIENTSEFIARLKKSNELKIRLETSLGSIRTLRFTTTGLTEKIKTVADQARAQMTNTPCPKRDQKK
jgi:hypothetical protein